MRGKSLALGVGVILLTGGCLGLGDSSGPEFGPESLTDAEIQENVGLNNLSAFESYTLNITATVRNGPRTTTLSSLYEKLNTTTERGLSRLSGFLNISTYTEGDVSYQRTVSVPEGELLYQRASEPYNDTPMRVPITPVKAGSSTYEPTDSPSNSLQNLTVTKQGYTTVNGEQVAVYSSTATGNFSAPDLSVEDTTFTTRSVTVYLNPDERIPSYELSYTGSTTTTGGEVTLEYRVELFGRNTTTVSTPDWVTEAENRTESAGS